MSLTTANSVLYLAVAGLFPVPQQIQGYATDDIFSTDPVAPNQVSMGVDGKLSGGFVHVERPMSISLQADSESNAFFDAWVAAQEVLQDTYVASGSMLLPGLNRKWTMVRGFLTAYPPMPDGGKMLRPRKYGITWQSITPAVA